MSYVVTMEIHTRLVFTAEQAAAYESWTSEERAEKIEAVKNGAYEVIADNTDAGTEIDVTVRIIEEVAE